MKKIIAVALALSCAPSAFAQGSTFAQQRETHKVLVYSIENNRPSEVTTSRDRYGVYYHFPEDIWYVNGLPTDVENDIKSEWISLSNRIYGKTACVEVEYIKGSDGTVRKYRVVSILPETDCR